MQKNTDTTTPATASSRRNMSHADCTHPATTDARTDCREAAKIAGTWPLPAPTHTSANPGPVRFTIGKGKAIHAGTGAELVAMCGVTGVRNGTDKDVTCKNCLKLGA
jgi:hypothetical protein